YKESTFFQLLWYDFILWLLSRIFDCFFREIRPRGAFRVPKTGPLIFVAAPHANQFIDPVILMNQVKQQCGRRISFLIAANSLKRLVIGFLAKSALSIGVNRPQDNLKFVNGKIFVKDLDNNPTIITGVDTAFTKDCTIKGLIALPSSLGTAVIQEIVSDTELIIKKPFDLRKNSNKIRNLLTTGTTFKIAKKVDQNVVYKKVFNHLSHNHCIGIFPEGGSHDRTTLLPLKAGVAIMALGAMANDANCNVKIIPCGMNYFHPHKYRSRAVIEFGHPIDIPRELVEKYSNSETHNDSVTELLKIVSDGLKSVTVECPDFETLMVVQTVRRLYSNNFANKLPLPLIIELNRRLVKGYDHFKKLKQVEILKEKILEYNKQLNHLHIPDHLVEDAKIDIPRNMCLLIYRSIKLLLLAILALPGTILFSPIFIATKKISKKKAAEALANSTVKIKANDVIATWKILISMVFAPLLYTFYATISAWYCYKYHLDYFRKWGLTLVFIGIYLLSCLVTYAALYVGDQGMDLFKSLRPLYLSVIDPIELNNLKLYRKELSIEITDFINEFGPELYPDFNLLEQRDKYLNKGNKTKKGGDKNKVMDSDDEEEELKTMALRRRRVAKKRREVGKERSGSVSSSTDI
ncbi:bifunctional glycerol-3-phosphate/glycerone-phosphate O-acyltransferase SCT1 ASCRUDRAFT_18217, partial [Ascoidea rubescens DSM 1968]